MDRGLAGSREVRSATAAGVVLALFAALCAAAPNALAQEDEPIAPPIFCASPYQQPATDGEAQWCEFDCADGTVPDEATQECVCAEGMVEIGLDRGRRVCAQPLPEESD